MKKILFVCHGNICRSPMAEYVMKAMVAEAGRADEFEIASAATSTEEIGNGVYPPVRRLLAAAGIDSAAHQARQMTQADYRHYDLIVAMDTQNLANIRRIIGQDTDSKVCRLLDFTPTPGDIADPWYTRDFDLTWRQVNAGCRGLLNQRHFE
ncbi:MAG: low molecular weight phosphotyrosine protein phosphatase [Bacteroidales bacterium]|nr:low molecular weight phosphotyrosine protein phosphatase [Bacteroidales bacterium]MDE7072835.1 low molecular weight phosphotyrosine protein phosphatase [Bacteroidales bacterium]